MLELEAWNPGQSDPMNNTHPCRFQPNVVIGARAVWPPGSADPVRPIIKLADNSPGFNDSTTPMPILDFTRNGASHKAYVDGTNFNQLCRGIDVHIGDGNPGATGIQLPGAQGSSVQDVTVLVGSGYSGITGGSGAGGGHAMLKIVGGKVGLDYTVSLNAPGTTGAVLINQTLAAVLYVGLEAASFVGAYIAPATTATPALLSVAQDTLWGQVSVIDTVVDYSGASGDPSACAAFNSSHSLYLRDVWVNGCAVIVQGGAGGHVIAGGNANGGAWSLIKTVVIGVPIPIPKRRCGFANMSAFVNGQRTLSPRMSDIVPMLSPPPRSVVQQHRWDEKTFPTWDMDHVINARDHGATGDASTDDSLAIQRAITAAGSGGVVFLPKGFYRLTRTLNVTCSAIIGTDRSLSVLMPMSDGLINAISPAPILRVGGDNQVVVSMLTIVTWEHLDSVWALDWSNSNPLSIYRQNYFYRITECFYGFPHPTPVPVPSSNPTIPCKHQMNLSHPLNLLHDGAAGKFYNFENEDFLYEAPEYRHLVISSTRGPLRLYNMNFEHAQSEANAEFVDAHNVFIFSLKTEGAWRDVIYGGELHNPDVALWVRNSSNINVFSFGGNARPMPHGSVYPEGFAQYPPTLYRFENSCPVVVTNLVDQFQFSPDDDWNFVYEDYHGQVTLTPTCERPVLFTRTSC